MNKDIEKLAGEVRRISFRETSHGIELIGINSRLKILEYMRGNKTTVRHCQKCGHRTMQEWVETESRIYRCLNCGTKWKPSECDEEVEDEEV